MFPTFNIFFYILSDELMPWLNENSEEKKFELLINQMGESFLAKSQIFFKDIIITYKKLNINISVKIKNEFEFLSRYPETEAAAMFYKAIFDLPALNYKQKFYNILIAQSIKSYYTICNNLLKYNVSDDLEKYYFNKIITLVNKILSFQVLKTEALSAENLEIIRKIQIVLTVLISKLKTVNKNVFNNKFINDTVFTLNTLIENDSNTRLKTNLQQVVESLFYEQIKDEPKIREEENNKKKKIADKYLKTEKITIYDLLDENNKYNKITKQLKNFPNNIKNNDGTKEIIKSSEVLELLKISKSTLCRLRKNEKIKCFKVNSQFRYCKEDILNFLNTK